MNQLTIVSSSLLAICFAYKLRIHARSNVKDINIRYNRRHEQHMTKNIVGSLAHKQNGQH